MAVVAAETYEALSGISAGDLKVLKPALDQRESELEATGLDARTFALAKIAALIALGAPPASYAWQVANAVDDGATPEDILGVLRAVAPQVGGARIVAAAPEIMISLGLQVPESAEYGSRR
jgi:alkylhydroperoxidase/carboxymuconolactone decarboxylase family protein YurZ